MSQQRPLGSYCFACLHGGTCILSEHSGHDFSVSNPPCAAEGSRTNENQYHYHCHHHQCHHHHYHYHHHHVAQRMPTSTSDHILLRISIWGCPSSLFSVCFVFLALFLFQKGRAIANFRKRISAYENSDFKLPHVYRSRDLVLSFLELVMYGNHWSNPMICMHGCLQKC